jgi:hypothetical protein
MVARKGDWKGRSSGPIADSFVFAMGLEEVFWFGFDCASRF